MSQDIYSIIINDLGRSRPTARTWIDNNAYPAEICLSVEQLTGGEITHQQLRPDLFVPTNAQIKLVDTVDKLLDTIGLDDCNSLFVITILNFLEVEQPPLYEQLVGKLQSKEHGIELLQKRAVHSNEKL